MQTTTACGLTEQNISDEASDEDFAFNVYINKTLMHVSVYNIYTLWNGEFSIISMRVHNIIVEWDLFERRRKHV